MNARPPAELAWLVDVIGAAATLALIEARGGTRVYVPREPTEAGALAIDVGLQTVHALAQVFGGDTIVVPVARTWRVRHYRAAGLSYPAIAHKLGCHERTVWRLLRSAETTQLALPV